MEFDDFGLMVKGFFAKRKSDEMNFANVGFIIDAFATGLSGKKPDYKKFIKGWFGETVKITKEQLKARSESVMKRVELMNKILEEKEKNAGAAKNSNRRRRK